MSTERSEAMASHPDPVQPSSRLQYIPENWRAARPLRTLAGGLFFVMFVLFARPAFSVDATLAWDPNNEPDLEGYGVYFSQDAPGPPYDLFGYVTAAELEDPSNPTFTVTGLDKGARYYIALTAYDSSGAESAYSAPVCADVGDNIAPCPSASTGDGGGGGGGACFIESSLGGIGRFDLWMAGPALLAGLAALTAIAWRLRRPSLLFSRCEQPKDRRRSNPDA
jgi:hypothetical protein